MIKTEKTENVVGYFLVFFCFLVHAKSVSFVFPYFNREKDETAFSKLCIFLERSQMEIGCDILILTKKSHPCRHLPAQSQQ